MKSGIWLYVSFLPAFFPFSLSYGLDFLTNDVFTFPMPLSWPRSFSHWRAPAGLAPPFTPLCVFSVAPWSPLLPSLGSSGPGVSPLQSLPLSCSCHTGAGHRHCPLWLPHIHCPLAWWGCSSPAGREGRHSAGLWLLFLVLEVRPLVSFVQWSLMVQKWCITSHRNNVWYVPHKFFLMINTEYKNPRLSPWNTGPVPPLRPLKASYLKWECLPLFSRAAIRLHQS